MGGRWGDSTRRKVEICPPREQGLEGMKAPSALRSEGREGATGGRPEAGGPGSGCTRVGPLRSVFVRGGGSLVSLVGAEGTTGRDRGRKGVINRNRAMGAGRKGDFRS